VHWIVNAAGCDNGAWRENVKDHAAQHGLARTGFTHEAMNFPLRKIQIDPAQYRHQYPAIAHGKVQIMDNERAGH